MMRDKFLWVVVALLAGCAVASAQERGAGAGTLEMGGFPGGGLFLGGGDDNFEVNFNNWTYGGGVSWYVNPKVAIEAEVVYGLGLAQGIDYRNRERVHVQAPNTLDVSGNLVFFPGGTDRLVAGYVTGGAGTLALISRNSTKQFGLTEAESFVAANVGGGVKIFRGGAGRNWGYRADYRVVMVTSKDGAVPFFAKSKNRMGHRFYIGLFYLLRR